jgi:small subunit ribosomal protein S15
MYLTAEVKKQVFKDKGFNKSETDTGSPESQIALFTHRINHLTGHLKINAKDYSTKLSLLKLVGKRRRFLSYLQKVDLNRYRSIIAELNIRK